MKKRKTRKLSMALKQIITIGLAVWFSICIVVVFTIQARTSDYKNLAGKETLAISTLVANDIDVDSYVAAVENGPQSEEFNAIKSKFTSIMEQSDMEYIYTIFTDGSSFYYGIDGDPEEPAEYGSIFEEDYDYLAPALNGEVIVDSAMEEADEDGTYLITAYVPIADSDGNVIALLACDYNANEIRNLIVKAWMYLFVFATGGTIIAGGTVTFIVSKNVKNIILLNDKIDELVSSNGDLTKNIVITSGDELENLANSMNTFMKYIREVVTNISGSSKTVNEASKIMADELNDAQNAINDVSSTMEEMSAGMEETSASLIEITENVTAADKEIFQINKKAKESAAQCYTIMGRAYEISEESVRVREEAVERSERVSQILKEKIENSKRVEEIHELVDAILQISNQTNLLSLNASIEAARAGESGRGFAVVADEIGKLANECKDSASRISEVSNYVIQAVNELAEEAEKMVTYSKDEIARSCDILKETGDSYRKDVRDISELLQQFTESCENITRVMNGIKEAVSVTNVAVEESAKGITSTAEALVTLANTSENIMGKANGNAKASDNLDAEVNKFRY